MRKYRNIKALSVVITTIFFLACREKVTIPSGLSNDFENVQDLGVIENAQINEASGIVAGIKNKDSFWVHNDGGDKNRIFLTDKNGKGVKEFYLSGAINRDWEAIAIGNFSDGSFLYIGDIGDNNNQFGEYVIYRLPEPDVATNSPMTNTINGVERITYQYPDGARDAECLMIDHQTKDIYILTKREQKKRLYRLSFPQSYTAKMTAEFIEEVNFSEGSNQAFYITDGNISPDNQEIIIKNYLQIFHWRRQNNESVANTLKRTTQIVPYTFEPQGEGVCFANNFSGYYTISEESDNKNPVHLYYYKRK